MSDILDSEEIKYRVMFNDFVKQSGDKGAAILGLVKGMVSHLSLTSKPIDFALQQDLVNEVAIAMLNNAQYINDIGPRRVLYTVVRNRYIDMIRKEARHQGLVVYDESPEDEQTGEPPLPIHWSEDQYLHRDCLDKIFGVIESQSRNEENLRILTNYAMGQSYAEVAKSTGRTITAVTSRIHDLREQLRELRKRLC